MIGPRGTTIQDIQRRSGTKIDVDSSSDPVYVLIFMVYVIIFNGFHVECDPVYVTLWNKTFDPLFGVFAMEMGLK